MKIHLNIEADTTAEILEAVKELAATGVITTQVKPVETKKRKPAASQAPEPEVDTPAPETVIDTSTPADDTPPAEENAPEVEAPSVEDIKKVAIEKFGNTPDGRKVIKGLLNQFESKSLSDLPEGKRAAFLAALEES